MNNQHNKQTTGIPLTDDELLDQRLINIEGRASINNAKIDALGAAMKRIEEAANNKVHRYHVVIDHGILVAITLCIWIVCTTGNK